ncbi:class I adenylate-forming enzyme family protein [Streptomyces sp. NPDC088747]|uniref:class I adenylate-forming enzyme family protein n=1 Tax=Streptomyces sp. NPDC088747 TaxID=3365886 RepID=UPI00382E81BA
MAARARLAELLDNVPAGAPAVEFDEAWWTWGDLKDVARRLAGVWTEAGTAPAARIGIVLENRPEHLAATVSLLAQGHCLVTLSPLQPPERLAADILRSEASAVICSPRVLAHDAVREAVLRSGLAVRLAEDGTVEAAGVGGAAVSAPGVTIEMLTSGTTGPPKRVRLGDRQFDAALVSSGQVPKPGTLLRSGTVIVATPMVHIGGLWGAVSALYAGRRLALLPRFDLDPWVSAVERHRPSAAGLVPAALRTVLDARVPPEKLSSLRVVTCGTSPCPAELADAFFRTYGARVLMTYGATEFAGAVTAWTLPLHEKWWSTKAGSAGRPVPGVRIRVVDPAEGTERAPGETGVLEVRTSQAPRGEDAWTRTSDLGRVDEDGFVWIEGRADDAIVRGGFKVQPEQVRAALERHPAVREAAVAGLADERLGHVPVAAVEVRPGHPVPGTDELTACCREILTPYEVPVHIAVVDALPRTPSSKVSRVELLELIGKSMAAARAA